MDRPVRNRHPMLSRAAALLAVGLVLALSVFAASPELHGRLHGHDAGALGGAHGDPGKAGHSEDDDGCVVTLFSQGLVLALAVVALAFLGRTPGFEDFDVLDRVVPDTPRYLHLPPQAPPLGLS